MKLPQYADMIYSAFFGFGIIVTYLKFFNSNPAFDSVPALPTALRRTRARCEGLPPAQLTFQAMKPEKPALRISMSYRSWRQSVAWPDVRVELQKEPRIWS